VSEHDRANTTNALELLQTGAFKLLPGKDTVPYEQLVSLRLEDGIDVTRKVGRARCQHAWSGCEIGAHSSRAFMGQRLRPPAGGRGVS
jgi:hypothetical protein